MSREQIPDDGQLLRPDIDMLHPSPTNPRTRFAEGPLQELAASIAAQGIMQPILVRVMPEAMRARLGTDAQLEIVAGERRWRASKIAGISDVPVILRDLDDATVIRLQIIENQQREDLSYVEEAEGYARLQAEGLSAQQIADQIGKSKGYVYAKLKLLALCDAARQMVIDRDIPESIALLVARVPVAEIQLDALEAVTAPDEYTGEPMSFRGAKRWVSENCTKNLTKAPFATDDDTLTDAGSCRACPHRLGNGEDCPSGSENVCTSPPCYELKRQAHNVRMLDLPDGTPRVEVPKVEGTSGPTNWTDYDAAGWRMLSSIHHQDPKRRSYADWLRDNGEHAPIAVHVCPASGDARAVVRIDDLIKAQNRIEAKAAATAEQPGLDIAHEDDQDTTEEPQPKAIQAAAPEPTRATPSPRPKPEKHNPLQIAYAQYRADLEVEILRNQPLLIGGPLLGLVANALEGSIPQDFESDGGAMAVILGHVIKNAKKWGSVNSHLEAVAQAVSVDPTPLLEKYLPVPEGCARPNEHGVYPKQHTINHGAGKTEIYIHIARTAAGWRGATEVKHPTGSTTGPISERSEAYATEKEAVAAISSQFADKIEQGGYDIPEKAQKPLVFWLRRLAGDLAPQAPSNVRYHHPENRSITWSGHGRKPQWVLHWIENGGALEDLENPDFAKEAA